jgi:hypothetical protein
LYVPNTRIAKVESLDPILIEQGLPSGYDFNMELFKKNPQLTIGLLLFTVILCGLVVWEYHKRSEARALCEAVLNQDEFAMSELLKFGVSPDWKTSRGETAREVATEEKCDRCLKLFRYYEYRDGGGLLSRIQ